MPEGDAPLRWCLLHLLGDAADARAGDFLVRAAVEKLPERHRDEGCEGTYDTELLVRTGAVNALRSLAVRHKDAAARLLDVLSSRPERPILIEAVKAAVDLGLADKVRELLPKDEHWILDIRRAKTQEVFADAEREDGKERGFTPPKSGSLYTAPRMACCTKGAQSHG
jgi:hypothetical protein